MISAQQYFIEYGVEMEPQRLQTLLPSYVPDSYLQKSNAMQWWVNAIMNKLRAPYFQNARIEALKVSYLLIMDN